MMYVAALSTPAIMGCPCECKLSMQLTGIQLWSLVYPQTAAHMSQ